MRKINLGLKFILFLHLCFITIHGLSQFNLTDNIPLPPDVIIGKLNNGLTYYIEKNTKPEKKVELRLVVNAGSILEDENQLGLAHFMEHMNFNGSKHFPKNELVNYLQTIGVKFGADLNAYTSFDETVYILPIPAEKPEIIEKGFTVLEDWAGGATITDEEVNKERGIVLEELRSRKGAQERMRNQYYPKLLNGSKYAERFPIGKEEVLKSFNPDKLRSFYHDWYRPDLMAVIVVGDIDPVEAETKIKEHFARLKNPDVERPRPAIIPIDARQNEEAISVSDREAEQTQIQITYYTKPLVVQTTWEEYKANLDRRLFAIMMNARFLEISQDTNPPFLVASSGFGSVIRGYETFSLTALTDKGDVKQSLNALVTEIERVKKFGFSSAELARAKTGILMSYDRSVKEKGKTNSNILLNEFIGNFLSKKPIPGIETEYAFLKQVLPDIKVENINEFIKDLDGGQKKFVLITGPEKRDVAIPANTELLALVNTIVDQDLQPYEERKMVHSLIKKTPKGGKIVAESKDDDLGIVQLTLNNGVKVTLKSTEFKNDEIMLSSSRLGGSSLYGIEDKYNVSYAAGAVVQMGVKDLAPTEYLKYLSGKSVTLTPYISETTEGFNGRSSKKGFETLLQLIYLYSTQPRFDDGLFKSYIAKQKAVMGGIFQNPSVAFLDTISKVLSQNNPLAPSLMHADDFDKINANRTFEIFKEKFSNAEGMNFFIVGNFDIDAVKPLIENYLGSIPATSIAHDSRDLGVRRPKGVVKFVYKKGQEKKSQVLLSFGGETIFNIDENVQLQAALDVLQIKIIEKLREEMSGIYGASVAGVISKIPFGKYTISISIPCGPENIDKLIAATIELINNLKKDGPSDIDLAKVKETWKKKYAEEIKTNNDWISVLNSAEINKTDPKRILNYEKRVDALTAADIKKVAIKYFDLNNYVTAILLPE